MKRPQPPGRTQPSYAAVVVVAVFSALMGAQLTPSVPVAGVYGVLVGASLWGADWVVARLWWKLVASGPENDAAAVRSISTAVVRNAIDAGQLRDGQQIALRQYASDGGWAVWARRW